MADQMKGMFDRVQNNKIRMGNFETIDHDLQCIRSLLRFPTTPFSAADLCAGSGKALELLTQNSAAVSFGVEPNEEKYLALRSRIQHALFGGYEECRISRDTFRFMYLNPPYDADSDTEDLTTERKEKRFLRQLLMYVSVDGILVYNIPRSRMTLDVVKLLVANLEDVRIFRSHDDTYDQVITIGRKRRQKMINHHEVSRIRTLVEAGGTIDRIPLAEEPLYKVLPGNVTPKLFRSYHMDVDHVREVINSSTLIKRGMEWSTPKPPAQRLQPLLPDKEMHRVLRMASGRLNGKVGKGDLLHVLKGIVKKETVVDIQETESEHITTETEVYRIYFKIVDRHGNIRRLEN